MTKESTTSRRGSAGRRGQGVRSDLWVAIELLEDGGIRIDLDSRVEPYYGDSIHDQVRSELTTMGIENAAVQIEDTGALPFVISARLEAAVRRAGLEPEALPADQSNGPRSEASPRDRLRRSRLYLPGNEPRFFINAALHLPDAVILDLEDSVAPSEKDAARLVVRNALRAVDFLDAERMVRINQLPLGLEDLAATVPARPDLILIPKVESPDQIVQVDHALSKLLAEQPDPGEIWLMPILESALGMERTFEIAQASPRIVALTLGLEDYAADLGVAKSASGAESVYARQRVVNGARAAGLQAIDSVYGDVDDLEGLMAWGRQSRQLGYQGMGCLHPRQIPVIHQAYEPTAAEIDKALRIVEAFEAAAAKGLGVVSLGSKMIDPPVVKQALRLVAQAKQLGLLPRGEAGEVLP